MNQGDWRRIPQTDHEFIAPDTEINLGKTASMLANKPAQVLSLRGEIWGWHGGTLIFLGNFDKNVTPPPQPLLAQDFTVASTTLYVGKPDPSAYGHLWAGQKSIGTLGTETFEWATGSENITRGQWQISTMPFTDNLDLNPPGLLLTGEAPNPMGDFALFTIDLGPLNPNKIPVVQLPNQSNEKLSLIPNLSPFGPPFYQISNGNDPVQRIRRVFGLSSSKPVSVVPPFWFIGSNSNNVGNPNNMLGSPSPTGVTPANLFIRYYVRVLPMKGDQAVGDPSNMVFLDYYWQNNTWTGPIIPPTVKPYELTITDVQPIHFPLSRYEYCIKITKNPYYDNYQQFASQHSVFAVGIYAGYKPGTVICPEKMSGHDKSWLEVLKDGFAAVLDKISSLYNELTDIVVDLAAKWNPLCMQAELAAKAAKQGVKTVDDVCHYVAKVAVEAAKAYVGLPPSIPNYDQLQGMGEDYLTDLAAQEMENAGVPCSQVCKDLIKQGIHDSYELVKDGFSNSSCMSDDQAHQLGFKQGICLPEGVKSVPDPRGQYSDGIVTVQITRKPGFKDSDIPPYCELWVGGTADNSLWVGKLFSLAGPFNTYGKMMDWQDAPLSGLAIENRDSVAIPQLQDGQTISIPVVVSRINSTYWIPGHEELWQGFVPGPYDDDWVYLYHGAMISVTADSLCAWNPSNTVTIGPVTGPFEDVPVK